MSKDGVKLRRWRSDEESVFVRLSEDPQVSRWTGRTVPSEELFGYYLSLSTAFAIENEGEVVGSISMFTNSLTRGMRSLSVYECAFYLFPSYWGMGLGTKALRELLEFARNEIGADAILAGALRENERSKKMIEANGGRYCFSRELSVDEKEDFFVFSL